MRILISIVVLAICFAACSEKEDHSSPADFGINVSEDTSVEYLLDLIDRRPGNINNYVRLSDIYSNSNKNELAIETLENALIENPDASRVQLLLTKYYLEEEDYEKAEEYFAKLNDSDESVDYSIVQAELLIKKGFYDKALQVLNRSIVKDDGNAELFYLKGIAQEKVSDTSSAMNNFETALRLENVKFSMVVDYLDLLAAQGRSEKFFEVYGELSREIRNRTELKLILAEILRETQNHDSAKFILHSINEKEFLGTKYLRLAEIHFDQYRYDSALYYADLSYDHKKNLFAKLVLARTLDKVYKYNDAEETYLQILESDSTFTIASEELDKLRRKVRYLRELRRKEERKKLELVPLKPIIPEN